MKLVENNARAHIHCEVINYLTEEVSIQCHIHLVVVPVAYWINDYMKRNLIDQENEKLLVRVGSKVVKNIPEEEFLTNC